MCCLFVLVFGLDRPQTEDDLKTWIQATSFTVPEAELLRVEALLRNGTRFTDCLGGGLLVLNSTVMTAETLQLCRSDVIVEMLGLITLYANMGQPMDRIESLGSFIQHPSLKAFSGLFKYKQALRDLERLQALQAECALEFEACEDLARTAQASLRGKMDGFLIHPSFANCFGKNKQVCSVVGAQMWMNSSRTALDLTTIIRDAAEMDLGARRAVSKKMYEKAVTDYAACGWNKRCKVW